ncbi:bacteriohemerythrin [Heliorestis acidaminivorans]|uniref:Bacteriohemerythrin n=1 Tax=Heliorestis acidaminivorans TaxID=553427 RepID=A0A6I0EUK8_9FIRM|nr:bacteriohemerythrin [Heliorestis acidaminivorans]KAB2952983.1 bacteriohemerythrin [Heliorestis acidaminivorans]
MKVEWNDELLTGLGMIDDQHKKLVARIASFTEAVNQQDFKAIEETVNYLIGYSIQHFGAEELIMIRNGYDEFKSHREEHSWFINKVYDLQKSLLQKELSQEQLEEMRDVLVNWTLQHIKIRDKRISEKISS